MRVVAAFSAWMFPASLMVTIESATPSITARIRDSLSRSASSARRRSPMSTKVTTIPSILSSTVR